MNNSRLGALSEFQEFLALVVAFSLQACTPGQQKPSLDVNQPVRQLGAVHDDRGRWESGDDDGNGDDHGDGDDRLFPCPTAMDGGLDDDDGDEDKEKGGDLENGHSHKRPRAVFCVDPTLAPVGQPELGVVLDAEGKKHAFALTQVVVKPSTPTELSHFLSRYNATVLVDGSPKQPPVAPGQPPPTSGYYLIHVDLTRSSFSDFSASIASLSLPGGLYRFSSLNSARLMAIVVREIARGNRVSINMAMQPDFGYVSGPSIEGADSGGTVLDYSKDPYANDKTPDFVGQLGIGVTAAWDYLEYKHVHDGPFHVPVIAIIDGGFWLDTSTGAPMNLDVLEGMTPPQFSVTGDGSFATNAGGSNPGGCGTKLNSCPWHGTEVFGVAAAVPHNSVGSAGSAGVFVTPYLIKVTGYLSYQITEAIGAAVSPAANTQADIINISTDPGDDCGEFCGLVNSDNFDNMQTNVNYAYGLGAMVVAAAGNRGTIVTNRLDQVPCSLDHVICVGAINNAAQRETFLNDQPSPPTFPSAAGPRVSIWAPDSIAGTNTPDNNFVHYLGGTSFSSPFTAGIIGLMKQMKPDLNADSARQILQATALPPHPGEHFVLPGYVNALGSLEYINPNQRPQVTITSPLDGATVVPDSSLEFVGSILDPEQPIPSGPFPTHVSWTIDGVLACNGTLGGTPNPATCAPSSVLLPGQHTVTLTAVDAFGASSPTVSITVTVVRPPPEVLITSPATGSTFASSQQLTVHGHSLDPVDGFLSGSSIAYFADSTFIGNATCTTPVPSDCASPAFGLSVGSHKITMQATNSAGVPGSAFINVTVVAGNDYPSAFIDSPADFFSPGFGTPVTLIGHVTDPVDPSFPAAAFHWHDDVDGQLCGPPTAILCGPSITVTLSGLALVPVYHTVTLSVTNTAGNTGTSTPIHVVVFSSM